MTRKAIERLTVATMYVLVLLFLAFCASVPMNDTGRVDLPTIERSCYDVP